MIAISILYILVIYTFIIDWAYLYPDHKTAYVLEIIICGGLLFTITYFYSMNPYFYGVGYSGRKVDLILFLWLSREIIHTRVRFNKHSRELTTLVSNSAMKDSQFL
jgi:hypothetical protein